MNGLTFVNRLFENKSDVEAFEDIAFKNIRSRYPTTLFTLMKWWNHIVTRYITFVVLCVMFYYMSLAESNLINWVFFTMNMINFYYVAKGDNKETTNESSLRWSKYIRNFSFLMLFLNILFALAGLEKEQDDTAVNSWD